MAALFPGERVSEWSRTEADFNGDGIEDLALLLNVFHDNEPMQTRVVVLAGLRGGGFAKLSVSAKYCEAQKFIEIAHKGPHLSVSVVDKADGDGWVYDMLQFRFRREVGDFELMGRENVWESFRDKSYGRLSVNYITGKSIEYKRERGRTQETRRARGPASPLPRLDGFDCEKWMTGAAS